MPKGDPAGYLPRVKRARAKGAKISRDDGGVDPKYQHSSFNPFGNKSLPPGTRIKRGADNRPNEGDSDWESPRDRAKPYRSRRRG